MSNCPIAQTDWFWQDHSNQLFLVLPIHPQDHLQIPGLHLVLGSAYDMCQVHVKLENCIQYLALALVTCLLGRIVEVG